MERLALRQSPCGIHNAVKVCHFVLLFFTCNVTSFSRIFIMFSSSGSNKSDKCLYKCSLLMVSNAFVTSSSKLWVEQSHDAMAFSHSIFIAKTCSVVLLHFLLSASDRGIVESILLIFL